MPPAWQQHWQLTHRLANMQEILHSRATDAGRLRNSCCISGSTGGQRHDLRQLTKHKLQISHAHGPRHAHGKLQSWLLTEQRHTCGLTAALSGMRLPETDWNSAVWKIDRLNGASGVDVP